VKKFLLTLNILLVIATGFSYLSPYIDPSSYWFFSFFGLAFPILLIANILFVIIWSLFKKKYVLLSLICLILGAGIIPSFIGLRPGNDLSKDENHIRVISYNMQYLLSIWSKDKSTYEKNTDKLIKVLQKYGPLDIICAPETNQVGKFSKGLDLEHVKKVPQIGLAILSRYPILDTGILDTGEGDQAGAWVDLDYNGTTLRVYGLYLQTNQISNATNELAKEVNPKEKRFWDNVGTIVSRYKSSAPMRVKQAKLIKTHAEKCGHPVLICGDFNDTPNSHVYHILRKGFQDSFRKKGAGIGTTFGGNLPALRIDYILADPSFKVKKYHTIKNKYSDHYAIFADLEVLL